MKINYYLVGLIFLTFFVISFITNILGALNPDIIKSFGLSLTYSAFLPFAFFIAYGVMSIPAGMLVEKFKEKRIMISAFIVAFTGALLFSIFPSYTVFIPSLFLMGSGMAMLQVAINPLLRVSGGEKHFAFNSVMAQLIFGGASFAAPIFLSYLILKINDNEPSAARDIFIKIVPVDLPWISLYWIFSLILLLMVFITLVSKFPEVRRKEDEKSGTWAAHKSLFSQKLIILYFIGIFSYVGTEQGVSYWLSEFLHRYYGYDPITTGAPVVGWFWGMMSVGCLFGLLLLKLFDARKILMGAVILAAAFLSLSLFTNGKIALITFPFSRIFSFCNVVYYIFFSIEFSSKPSWFFCRNSLHCNNRRSSYSAFYRMAWRFIWIKSRNVFHLCNTILYFFHRYLGKSDYCK